MAVKIFELQEELRKCQFLIELTQFEEKKTG